MKPVIWIGGIVAVILGIAVLTSADDEATAVNEDTTNNPASDIAAENAPAAASVDDQGEVSNDVVRTDDYAASDTTPEADNAAVEGVETSVAVDDTQAATGPGDLDLTAEGSADRTEVTTSDIGAASNAATDAAVEEIAEGDAPTSTEVVEQSRDLAAAEGVVGALADYQVETFDPEIVYRGIAESNLDTTVQNELAAELDEAVATEDDAELDTALSDIREALGIADN